MTLSMPTACTKPGWTCPLVISGWASAATRLDLPAPVSPIRSRLRWALLAWDNFGQSSRRLEIRRPLDDLDAARALPPEHVAGNPAVVASESKVTTAIVCGMLRSDLRMISHNPGCAHLRNGADPGLWDLRALSKLDERPGEPGVGSRTIVGGGQHLELQLAFQRPAPILHRVKGGGAGVASIEEQHDQTSGICGLVFDDLRDEGHHRNSWRRSA